MPLSQRGYELYEIGKERWFHPEEIYDLLTNYIEMGFELCNTRVIYPQAGSFYLFHRLQVPDFKSDEIEWEKKKSSQTVHEQYLKLLIKGVHVITGQYATSSVDSCFRRRSYRLAEQKDSYLYLVHYRNCEGDAYVRKAKKNSSLKNDQQFLPSNPHPQYTPHFPLSQMGDFPGAFSEDDQMVEAYDVDYQDLLLLVSQSSEEEKNLNHNETLKSSNPISQIPLISTIKIIDFAPIIGPSAGGEKVLVCLDQDIPSHFDFSQIQVILSPSGPQGQHVQSMVVPAEVLASNVIRFYTPPLTSSHPRFVLMICNTQGVMISLPSGTEYTYDLLVPSTIQPTTRPKKRNPSSIEETESIVSTDPLIEGFQKSNDMSQDTSRIHKIRIVEKLLTHNSLQGVFPSPISPNLFNFETSDDDWLDDKSVSLLSSSDLEKLMDKYMFNVVNQLVQLAISDDDLKAELDHLDSSGYSLLHYCCLFNLTSLVDILLTKGANVHLMTATGSTALHLAADAGHYFIVQQLVSAGADINVTDSRGLTPAESALTAGQPSLASYWHLLSKSEYPTTVAKSIPANNLSPNLKFGPSFTFDQSKMPVRQFRELSSEDEEQLTDSSTFFSSVKDSFFTPPVSRRPSSVGLDLEHPMTPTTNMTLLQGAVSSLSLADKCALSLSLGNSGMKSPDDLEVQSVLSEYEKESLDVAMSMMGPNELSQVENEVRIIQNGVRTWLLRKNYINLRDAARTLQVAWRGRKHEKSTPMNNNFRRAQQGELATIDECTSAKQESLARASISHERYCDSSNNLLQNEKFTKISNEQVAAAATLQAATRGMLARKEFHDIKRQAMASLVIQKSLLHWWEHKGLISQSQQFHNSTQQQSKEDS